MSKKRVDADSSPSEQLLHDSQSRITSESKKHARESVGSGNNVPNGWREYKLRQLASKIGSGSTPRGGSAVYESTGIPLIRSMNVHFSGIKMKGMVYLGQEEARKLENSVVHSNDVLLNITGASIGRVTTVPQSLDGARVNQHVCIIRTTPVLLPAFLSYFLASPQQQARIREVQTGATRPAITKGMIQNWIVPVASISEQRRIVAEIERQFTRLDAGLAAMIRVQAKLKKYRAAVLKSACEGTLSSIIPPQTQKAAPSRVTETGEELLKRILSERRATRQSNRRYREPTAINSSALPSLPPGWVWASIDQIGEVQLGRQRSPANVSQHFPTKYIRAANITERGIDISDILEMEFTPLEQERFALRNGDLLLSEASGSLTQVGKPAIWRNELPLCCFQNTVVRVRPILISEQYLLHVFMHFYVNGVFANLASGVGINHLGAEKLASLPVPLPPLTEQDRIVAEVDRRLSIIDNIESLITSGVNRAEHLRRSILQHAFDGKLTTRRPDEEAPDEWQLRIAIEDAIQQRLDDSTLNHRDRPASQEDGIMDPIAETKTTIDLAIANSPPEASAAEVFSKRYSRDHVYGFYDSIADSPSAIERFSPKRHKSRASKPRRPRSETNSGPFRLHHLWIKQFKNLNDYSIHFDRNHALDILLGWNGTGKSNLFEVIIVIMRDLYLWQSRNKWPSEHELSGYRLKYETDGRVVGISWDATTMKRPHVQVATLVERHNEDLQFERCKREDIPLPHFVFGYYSGPSNRFADLFSEHKQDHYDRLLKQKSDDEDTLAQLLEERRFFNAETHHAKYALLSFFYEDDPGIRHFLKKHLRIVDLESVLFVLKRPRWHRNNNPEDFWGADGLLRPVLERLRRHSIAPMVLPQRVDDGFQESTRDHYFLLLPTRDHLQSLASEYADPTSFFVALESTDFSSIIQDVRIRVRIRATATTESVITFKEMSEGEQQLLMVLGLLRFTKMNQSLVLLDEPDTHLNPHWQLGYLHLLLEALVGSSPNSSNSKRAPIETLETKLSSQVLLSTHDPLAIAGLLKENIHLLKRADDTEECIAVAPSEDPRGMGFTGILTSEMFGLKSDLDEETLSLLHEHAKLAGKRELTRGESKKLAEITTNVERLGFQSASSDPYYRAYLQALSRRRMALSTLAKTTWTSADIARLAKETDEILEELEQEDRKK